MMDARACFIQTLLGLACYSQGLRDKGIALLNSFGITASAFHTREHGSLWAKLRSAIKEINPRAFWSVTFDNLGFRMKFAKCISTGGHLKRMLHLLTSQVTFRKKVNDTVNIVSEPVTLSSTSNLSMIIPNGKKYSEHTFQITLDGTTSAASDFHTIHNGEKFDKFLEWLDNLTSNTNSNEVCRFWAQMLKYLHAYTGFDFAIRSGNWLLRISCLKTLTELFLHTLAINMKFSP